MKKPTKHKLTIKAEVVKTLGAAELDHVVGGFYARTQFGCDASRIDCPSQPPTYCQIITE